MTRTNSQTPRVASIAARLAATLLVGISLATRVYPPNSGFLIAGRWSPAYATAAAAVIAVGGFGVFLAWRDPRPEIGAAVVIADAGVLVWAVAYLCGTIVANEPATRLFYLRVFGSITPFVAMTEWAAMLLLVLAAVIGVAPRLRGRWREVGLLVGTVAVFLVLAEGVARAYTLIRPTTSGYNSYTNEVWHKRHSARNSLGFRDVEPSRTPSNGRRRLALIGDSFGFGWGIDRLEDRFGEQLGVRLRSQTGMEWETMNASIPNTHTLHHEKLLERVLRYKPDLVVLLYVFNDNEYQKRRVSVAGPAPADFRRAMSVWAILMRNSYLFQELYLRAIISAGYRRAQLEANIAGAYADSALVSRHLADLARFVRTARDSGAVVLIVPFDIGVVANERLRRRDEAFIARATAAGLPLCSITTAFEGQAFRSLTVNALDLHPNERANALAADAAVECIGRGLTAADAHHE